MPFQIQTSLHKDVRLGGIDLSPVSRTLPGEEVFYNRAIKSCCLAFGVNRLLSASVSLPCPCHLSTDGLFACTFTPSQSSFRWNVSDFNSKGLFMIFFKLLKLVLSELCYRTILWAVYLPAICTRLRKWRASAMRRMVTQVHSFNEETEVLCQVLKKSASHYILHGRLPCKLMPATVKRGLPNPAAHRAWKKSLLQDCGWVFSSTCSAWPKFIAATAHVKMQHFSQSRKFWHCRMTLQTASL